MKEIWKDIKEYEGYYQVSNLGRVKSLDRKAPHNMVTFQTFKSVVIKPWITSRGYTSIALCKKRRKHTFSVHRLVAQAFLPNPDNKPQVNHIDGNKFNNHMENLEWCTQLENMAHALNNGLIPRGEKMYNSKLKKSDILDIRKDIRLQKVIAEEYNVSSTLICKIKSGKAWRHV